MAACRSVLLSFLVLVNLCDISQVAARIKGSIKLERCDFPNDFVFGAASAAYQIEGAAREGGRGPSIWDTFTHQHPDKIVDHSNGDVAADFYHHYKDDIGLLKDIGMNAFRFSISWSRILPYGKISKGVNDEGIKFYNNVINELLQQGLKPFVTLFHWDVPQALEDEYGGFLNPKIVNDYRDFVDVCFKEFGDRVKYWITLNEPFGFSISGYETGTAAPGRCSKGAGSCTQGNSLTEPYIVGHHLLLSHAAAVQLYRQKYQTSQKGEIGITNNANWYMPQNNTKAEIDAVQRSMDSSLGWFLDPIVHGDYPRSLKAQVSNGLLELSPMQSKMLKGSYDFLGINYYVGAYPSPTGKATANDQVFVYPKGIRELMLYIKKKYKNPIIYITENGSAQFYNGTMSSTEARNDTTRIEFFQSHLGYLQQAVKKGARVKGHIAWSLLDDFEWGFGYTIEFGLFYVDRKDGMKRYPKLSARWYKKFLNET